MDQHSKLGYREGLVSVILNLLLFVLKYYAGIASASLALIADYRYFVGFGRSRVYERRYRKIEGT